MNHTPTPWETRELSNGDWAISQKGAPTAHTTVHTWNGKEESVTAQFIVQACNAHEELLEALKELVNELEICREWGSLTNDHVVLNELLIAAKKAIAKAEGKEML